MLRNYSSIILLSLSLFMICSCNDQAPTAGSAVAEKPAPAATGNPLLDKLVGTWQSGDGKSFERWNKLDNGNYTSVAFSIKGADTSWNEHASIYPEDANWVFENTVTGQNDGKAVKFTSTLLNDNSIQFSNPDHDFPTDVNYTIPDANTVHAFIIGPNNKGGKDTIPFNYTRLR